MHFTHQINIIFAIREPRPSHIMAAIILSTFMYCREKSSPAIPSLTLWPVGLDRSRMRFPRLVALEDDVERVHMEDKEGRLSEGAHHPACLNFQLQVIVNDMRV